VTTSLATAPLVDGGPVRAPSAAGGGGGVINIEVPVEIDGREVGRATARVTAQQLRLQGFIT